jgi:hypothetical protein
MNKIVIYVSIKTIYFLIKNGGFNFHRAILPAIMWPVFGSVSNRSEYQEYILGGGKLNTASS